MSVERVQDVISTASYTASGTTVAVGAFTANELAAMAGVLCAIATFAVNWYYRLKHYKLAERLTTAQIEELKDHE